MRARLQPETPVSIFFAVSIAVCVLLVAGCSATVPPAVDPTCSGSLRERVDNAAPGDVIVASGGCVYRETITIDEPITLRAAPGGSEIRGSNVWGNAMWRKQGSTWVSRNSVPRLATDDGWKCERDVKRCRWPEQVYIDGKPLEQVAKGNTPGAGQFRVNADRRVILGESPIGKITEVTVRNHWIKGELDGAAGVTLEGFTMTHAASDGILSSGNDNWTIRDGDFSRSHTSNILVKRSTGALVSGSEIHHAGQKGVAGNEVDLTLQGNEIFANNTEGFNSTWNAGGVKVSNPQTVTFAENTVYDNRGNGLWLDVPTADQVLVVRDNRVHHNDASGIRSEVTDDDVRIYGNVVWENGWGRGSAKSAGISLNASHNNRVYDNVVAWNENGIRVTNSLRSEVHPDETEYDSVYDIEVDNNDILMDAPPNGAYALGWVMTTDGNLYDPAANNRGHDNRYWYPAPEDAEKRYTWDTELDALGAFNDTPGEENARYLSDAEKNELVRANGIPNSPRLSDPTGPSITIATPTRGASYELNQAVDARYSCEDEAGGSGLASCEGSVADGAPIDTGSTGSYDFTVTATDNAGNTTSLTHDYTVAGGPRPNCTITGTPENDDITGTPGDDTVCAGAGKDTIRGLAGNDTLRGEGGMDTLLGGIGDDTMVGGLGPDTVSYSASATVVEASLATDSATGEGSDDFLRVENLVGSPGPDTLAGSDAANTLMGRGGNDTGLGGPGDDTVVGEGGADSLYGQDGSDTLHSQDGVEGNDRLDGGAGTDSTVSDATEKAVVGIP